MKAIPALCFLMIAHVDSVSLTVMGEKIRANLMLIWTRFSLFCPSGMSRHSRNVLQALQVDHNYIS